MFWIDHVGVVASDLDVSVAFYTKLFGPPIDRVEWRGEHAANVARLMGRPPGLELDAVFFRIPHTNAIFELVQLPRHSTRRAVTAGNADFGATHFGFAVDDIEATVARLGLEVSGTPMLTCRSGRTAVAGASTSRTPTAPTSSSCSSRAARAGCRSFDRATHRPVASSTLPRPGDERTATGTERGPGAERRQARGGRRIRALLVGFGSTNRAVLELALTRPWLEVVGIVVRSSGTRRGSRRPAGSPGRRPSLRCSTDLAGTLRDLATGRRGRGNGDTTRRCPAGPGRDRTDRHADRLHRRGPRVHPARATLRRPPRSLSSQPSIASRSSRPGPIPASCWTCGRSPCPAWPGTWSGCGHGASST